MKKNEITNYPKSIGVILDGNRRWARARGLPSIKGHEAGYEKIKELTRWAKEYDISAVYLYAFSTENWHRPKEEVAYLMNLCARAFSRDAKNLIKEKVRVKFAGQIERFSPIIRRGIYSLEKITQDFSSPDLIFCLSYGGRAEILAAIKKIAREKTAAEIENLTEKDFSSFLWTRGLPDPELIIRTSGEIRTSNFLPWQTVYSEWFFTKTCWPALTKNEFEKIIRNFSRREKHRGR